MEENKLNKSNKIKIIVLTLLIFFIAISGITYAYFSIQIRGNEEASSMRLTTANLSLVYNDVQIVSGENVIPGWTQTKTLTVYNDGNQTAYYNIIWRDLYNEITNNELVISATCTSSESGNTCPNISETVIPTETTLAHNISIKRNIEIEVGEIHTYQVTVTFKETGSVQNYNQDKEFYGTLNIEEGLDNTIRRAGTDSTTGLQIVKIGNEEFFDLTTEINYSIFTPGFLTNINYDENKTILLARYNLYVGRTCTNYSESSCTLLDKTYSKYGLQSAAVSSSFPNLGMVPFSGSSTNNGYWYDSVNSTLKSQYGASYNASNIYDTDYVTAPNWSVSFRNNAGNANYSIAYYVEEYVEKLAINATGRLLTRTEVAKLSKLKLRNGAIYWLATANASNLVYFIDENGRSGSSGDFGGSAGVRPVIVVNTSDIQTN